MSRRTASRLTRILAMLPWVIANPGVTVDEVAERFGYGGVEDLARDLEMVFVCGLPGYGPGDLMVAYIEDDEVVVDMADYFDRSPRLTPTEALSMLAAGMTVMAAGQGSPALESAVDKLAALVAPDVEEGLAVEVASEPELVGKLRQAAVDARVVEITYTSLAKGDTTTRKIEPWTVFTSLGNWYVTGYCQMARDERIFRVDRIRSAERTDETFDPPAEKPEPRAHYTPSDDDVQCLIALRPEANWVLDYYPVDVMEEGEETLISFSAADPTVAARLLLRLGDRARLVQGDEVEESLADLGARILARYG